MKAQVIVADPPWRYGRTRIPPSARLEETKHYETMTHEELLAMDVAACADENALLFLWATSPMLMKAGEVMKAWGFEYQCNFKVWSKCYKDGKPVCGIGFYHRASCEYLLLGRRGPRATVHMTDARLTEQQLYRSTRASHSRKPEGIMRAIERYVKPDTKKLELFARRKRPGWHVWGNEVTH